MFDYDGRLAAFRDRIRAEGAAAAVIAPTDHMRYLTGWAEPAGERFLTLWVFANGDPAFVVPELYRDDVARGQQGVRRIVSFHDNGGWAQQAQEQLARTSHDALLLVDDDLPSGHLLGLQGLGPERKWLPVRECMARLRGVKSVDELEALERSAAVADQVYLSVVTALRPGVSEASIQGQILRAFADAGSGPAWAIVAFGPNTAIPHHRSDKTELAQGDVIILDLGCELDGYQSDITRTLALGAPDPEAVHAYSVVLEAHRAAMQAARVGVLCQDVDRAARTVIAEAGYGERFIHRTGHGIGMATHEPPNLVEGDETPLAPGMCFSDEPGIYIPGRFGVRVENIICITEAGARSLNAPPPEAIRILEP